jgi:hypothetical protein
MVMAATTSVADASVSRWSLSQERVNFMGQSTMKSLAPTEVDERWAGSPKSET